MKHKSFFWFVFPSAIAMILFIAAPIVSVLLQSVYAPHEQVIIVTENCGPFGCTEATAVDQEATRELWEEQPLGRFVGSEIYLNRNHLATAELGEAWQASTGIGDFIDKMLNLPFYGALAFTLTYTAVVTPLAMAFGFLIAVTVNGLPKLLRGPT
ncbi:MAG: sugar ABC transporter permease, partial [Pseudomonadota bacterium]